MLDMDVTFQMRRACVRFYLANNLANIYDVALCEFGSECMCKLCYRFKRFGLG